MARLPRIDPLSWLKGARPASAAAWRRLSWPSSGICASKSAAVRTPTPLIAVSFCALTQSVWSCAIKSLMPLSSVLICVLILLIRLRLKLRSSVQLSCADDFLLRLRSCSDVGAVLRTDANAFARREWRGWLRLQRAAKSSEHFRINPIGLGQDASRPRVLAHTHCLHQSNFDFALF